MADLPRFLRIKCDIPHAGSSLDDPKEVGFFTVDDAMQTKYNDPSAKRYYYKQPDGRIELDLNVGYDENFTLTPFPDEKIDNVLNWIMDVEKFQPVMSDKAVDFVTSRGTISKLLCTPFCTGKFYRWRIYASKFRGTVYLVAEDPEDKVDTSHCDPNYRRRMYWGKKFEHYLTTKLNVAPDLSTKCFDPAMYCILGTNRIGSHSLLFRAEMDGLKSDPEYPGDTSQYVELKTCHINRELTTLPRMTHKIWSQCIVAGVQDVVCGYRDDAGIVREIGEYKTAALPSYQSYGYPVWSTEACFNFCNYFLSFLKTTLKDDYKSVLRFDYDGRDKIHVQSERDKKHRLISDKFVEKYPKNQHSSQLISQQESQISLHTSFCKIHV